MVIVLLKAIHLNYGGCRSEWDKRPTSVFLSVQCHNSVLRKLNPKSVVSHHAQAWKRNSPLSQSLRISAEAYYWFAKPLF